MKVLHSISPPMASNEPCRFCSNINIVSQRFLIPTAAQINNLEFLIVLKLLFAFWPPLAFYVTMGGVIEGLIFGFKGWGMGMGGGLLGGGTTGTGTGVGSDGLKISSLSSIIRNLGRIW